MSDGTPNLRVSIVIPAFNEAGTILRVLEDVHGYMRKTGLQGEIIVVNDGSSDGTKAVLEGVPYVTAISHKLNRGYSASLKTGIAKAQCEWILTLDGDGAHPASQIAALLPYAGEYDLVVGARDGKLGYDTPVRRMGRAIVTRFAEYVSQAKIDDINSGFRLFKKSLALKFWHLFPEGFSFSTTISVAAHVRHFPVKYVYVEVQKRKAGKSSIKPIKDFVGFLSIIMRLAIYFRPLRVFVPLALFFFASAVTAVIVSYAWTGEGVSTTFTVLVSAGMQTIVLGLIAEMIVKRFYDE